MGSNITQGKSCFSRFTLFEWNVKNCFCQTNIKLLTLLFAYFSIFMSLMSTRDGGNWWSKDHHLVVIKTPENVDYFLINVEKW